MTFQFKIQFIHYNYLKSQMISIPKHIQHIIQKAATAAMPELGEAVQIVPQKNEEWDYQCASAMQFFNKYKKNGSFGFATCQDMAAAIVKNLPENDSIEKIELSKIGKGPDDKSGYFLNIFLKDQFVHQRIAHINSVAVLKLDEEEEKKQDEKHTVLVDFSSPNIAKNMHVGHLRSTIQGDSICRIFEFMGYDVKRINHVGDWGTQFGMLIQELNENFPDFLDNTPNIADLQTFYQNAKKRFDLDEEFKKKAHENVVKLQSGDEGCLAGWKMLCELSRKEFQKIYDRMDITLKEQGESFYNPMLQPMVQELKEKGIAVESDGAQCIFVGKKKGPPLMVQKSDGGFGYAATDLAALRYRVNEVKCNRIVYVTDVGQELHFKQVFEGGEKCGFVDPKVTKLDHMMFGMVLQENVSVDDEGNEVKKAEKIKTREGKSTKLSELLDEARDRALKAFEERAKAKAEGAETEVRSEDLDAAAEILGISSIKYFDLKQNRTQNYVFSFDQMLDPKGNTGVYLIYSYARICSILRKANFDENTADLSEYVFTSSNKSQRDLALTILRLPEAIEEAAKSLMVNRITDQLHEIATKIGEFYHNTKVIGSENEKSSVALLLATKRSMEICFNLLGMKTIDKI